VSIATFKKGMKIGTSSLRRTAQLRSVNPDIEIIPIRGNIETRLQKVDQGLCDAIVVAAAAILRLSLENRISEYLDIRTMLPAPAQGAIGLECRHDDLPMITVATKVNHAPSMSCIVAERMFLQSLGANCHVPVACLATPITQDIPLIQMQGMIASLDGRNILFERTVLPAVQAEGLGQYLAQRLLAQGGKEILDAVATAASAGHGPVGTDSSE
jgi:hydroxymethylbilane synthase